MTTYEEMEKFLLQYPTARERKNKARVVRHFLIGKYPELNAIDQEKLQSAIIDASNYDRAWRRVTETCPDLRGNDYGLKAALVKHKQRELGY